MDAIVPGLFLLCNLQNPSFLSHLYSVVLKGNTSDLFSSSETRESLWYKATSRLDWAVLISPSVSTLSHTRCVPHGWKEETALPIPTACTVSLKSETVRLFQFGQLRYLTPLFENGNVLSFMTLLYLFDASQLQSQYVVNLLSLQLSQRKPA